MVKNLTGNAGDLGLIPGQEDLLEEETATCSSILAWRIPWMEEPGGLQSPGSQRIRHDGATEPACSRISYLLIVFFKMIIY